MKGNYNKFSYTVCGISNVVLAVSCHIDKYIYLIYYLDQQNFHITCAIQKVKIII